MGEEPMTPETGAASTAVQSDTDGLALEKVVEENPHCKQLSAAVARPYLEASLTLQTLHDEGRFMSPLWPRMVYKRRPDSERSSCHWGQLKLFESELKCFTDFGLATVKVVEGDNHASGASQLDSDPSKPSREQSSNSTEVPVERRVNGNLDKLPVILYVGAAPGRHIPAIARRFPACRLELYDPAKFDQRVRDFAESAEAGGRVTIVQDFFDDNCVQQISARTRRAPLIFVCDIRTADPLQMGGDEVEEFIERDMARQRSWVEALRPDMSLLKFRLPWGPGETQYLPGRVLVQVFPPCTSTETRLLVSLKDLDTADAKYDHEAYNEQLMFHNTIKRAQLHRICVPCSGVGAVTGLDHCFDCAALAATVRSYLASQHGTSPECVVDQSVGEAISAIIAEITESGRTLATPYHVSSSRHGGRHFAKRRYVDAAGQDCFSVEAASGAVGAPPRKRRGRGRKATAADDSRAVLPDAEGTL